MFVTSIFAEEDKKKPVLEFTDESFDNDIKKHDQVLVNFYSPYCEYCMKLEPEYTEAADTLSKQDPPVTLARVDASKDIDFAKKWDIEGVPTLRWFVNQKPRIFHAGKTTSEIIDWVKTRAGPSVKKVDDSQFASLTKKEKIVVSFLGDTNSTEYSEFKKVADNDSKHVYVHNPSSLVKLHKNMSLPRVHLHKKYKDTPEVYERWQSIHSSISDPLCNSTVAK